jgi:hypothetical protein
MTYHQGVAKFWPQGTPPLLTVLNLVPWADAQVETERVVKLRFNNVGKLPPPVLQFSGVSQSKASLHSSLS